ncbi:MAG: acyltransferase [Myxococcaceae bacterium]|nr:acyltransferase [Myxococcaceae bacterium]
MVEVKNESDGDHSCGSSPAPGLHRAIAYRSDIDGLRALAVIPVVLFHLGVPGFWGGFIGVDVFFVISGFLITGIVAQELRASSFSLVEFYRRRVLRIFPALFVMMATVAAIANSSMLPHELARFAKSIAATTLFSSNIAYHLEAGYFAPAAHLKPLLHTWSLAVEEQFYLLWPVIMAACYPFMRRRLWWVAALIAVLSFSFSLWQVAAGPSAAFYLLPARAWELLFGAGLALAPHLRPREGLWSQALGIGSLLAILLPIKFYSDATAFPGLAALPPCLGAALLISIGARSTITYRFLSQPAMVGVGKLSFSLYLWHWPVIVLTHIVLFRESTSLVRLAQFLASFGLGYLSWRYVEQPFRTNMREVSSRNVLIRGSAVMAVAVGASGFVMFYDGLPNRFVGREEHLASYESYDGDAEYRAGSCFVVDSPEKYVAFDSSKCLRRDSSRTSVLLAGDSHAAHLWPGLSAVQPPLSVLQATHTGCRPLAYGAAETNRCKVFFREIIGGWLRENPVELVVLAGRWTRGDLPTLSTTVQMLKAAGQRVAVVGPIPEYVTALPKLMIWAARSDNASATLSDGRASLPFEIDAEMHDMCRRLDVPYVSLINQLCHRSGCQTYAQDGEPLQFDYGHLTVSGSRDLVSSFAGAILEQPHAEHRIPTKAAEP